MGRWDCGSERSQDALVAAGREPLCGWPHPAAQKEDHGPCGLKGKRRKKKNKMTHAGETYLVTRSHIQSGDTSDFMNRYGPTGFTAEDLRRTCGALRLRIEGAEDPRDVYAEPQTRRFFRTLHKQFPYWGFFLRLRPLRSLGFSAEMIDVGVFVAIGLCHADILEACWDRHNHEIFGFNGQQFQSFLADVDRRIAELGRRAGLSAPAIHHRRRVVAASVQSYLSFRGLRTTGT